MSFAAGCDKHSSGCGENGNAPWHFKQRGPLPQFT